jgi:glycosyltransferase involved in cell wall biosynthesis
MPTQEHIWFVSKYGVTADFGLATRHYFLSKSFVKNGYCVSLITSQSADIQPYFLQERYFKKYELNAFDHYLIKGDKISFGFSVKRIISWLMFECRTLRLAFSREIERPSIVIVSSLSILTFLTGIILKYRFGAKLIVEVRDIWPATIIEIGGYSRYNPAILLLSFIEKLGYYFADGIVGTMPKLDEHVKTVIRKKFNFICIPQGYEEGFLNENVSNKSQNLLNAIGEISQNKFVVCYAGTLGKANLVSELIDAAALLKERNNIQFIILGNGGEEKKLREQAAKLPHVTFVKALSQKEINTFLRQVDLLILLVGNKNIYQYGISTNKTIDYMLSGKPIICAYGGYQSIINEANCGFFIEPNNAKLLADTIIKIEQMSKETQSEIGQNGLSFVQKYHNFDYLAEKYLAFIHSC